MGRERMLGFGMDLLETETITARAGLTLVIEAVRALRLDEEIGRWVRVSQRVRGFSEVEKLEALMLLIAAGGDRIEDIRILHEDKGLLRLLERTLPSPDALLDFLSAFEDSKGGEGRPAGERSYVPPETEALAGLAEVNRVLVERAVAGRAPKVATVDHDGTIIESHKESATIAYEGTRGYQPLVAVWAEEDLIVADEFRDGNVPGGKDPLASVQRAFSALPASVTERYFRGDSADYHIDLLKFLVKEKIQFSISADMSQALRDICQKCSEENWHLLETRETELVHWAEVEFTPGDWTKTAEPLRYVALRLTPRQLELIESSTVRYLAVVTNRKEKDMAGDALLHWHWGKAGTIEHVHRVLKDELGAGVLPGQRFGMNAAWFRINVLTHNLLTVLKRGALPNRYRTARPKRLRFEIFTLPGKLVLHERQVTVRVNTTPERLQELICARRYLAELWDTLSPSQLPLKFLKTAYAKNKSPATPHTTP